MVLLCRKNNELNSHLQIQKHSVSFIIKLCVMYNQADWQPGFCRANRRVVWAEVRPVALHMFLDGALHRVQPRQTCDLNLCDRRSVPACLVRRSVCRGINGHAAVPLTAPGGREGG